MNTRRLSLVLILLAAILSISIPARAQSDSLRTSATYTFGQSIRFSAVVNPDLTMIRAAVFLRSGISGSTVVRLAAIDSGDPSTATLEVNPVDIGLGAFETLVYWWQIDLASSPALRSPDLELVYLDDRFSWDVLETDRITLLSHDRTLDQSQEALQVGRDALEAIAQAYTLFPSRDIKIVLYNNAREMQAGLDLAGPTWIGGNSRPEAGIVLLSAAPGPEGLIDLERYIPHELVHLLLDQRSDSGTTWIPAWLAEGMATLVEKTPLVAQRQSLEDAIQQGDLIPIVDLCASFPVAEDRARLAYAESASFVRYLLDVYGQGGLNTLLDAYREGTTCDGAVLRVYQRSLSQLDSEWQRSVGVGLSWTRWQVYVGIGTAVLLSAVIIFWLFRRQRSHQNKTPSGALDA
ncbi:MAG: peptidase MA family metallohydrolase [Anaerolineales bacterium]